MLAGLVVGTAYSTPPLRLKRFPVLASLSISGVRSVVVNLGVYAHFSLAFGDGTVSIPAPVWALTLVVMPFSLAIAILKDVPDAEGDRRYRIMTFTVRLGGRRVMHAGVAALALGYLGMAILGPLLIDTAQPVVLAGGQLAALALLLVWARGATPPTPRASPASTCACGSCSSSSTRSSRWPASPAREALATLAQHEQRDQGGDPARQGDRERRPPLEHRERPPDSSAAASWAWKPPSGGIARGGGGAMGPGAVVPGPAGGLRCWGLLGAAASSLGVLSAPAAGTGEPTYLRRRGRSSSAPARRRPRAAPWGTPPGSRRGRSGRRAGGIRRR